MLNLIFNITLHIRSRSIILSFLFFSFLFYSIFSFNGTNITSNSISDPFGLIRVPFVLSYPLFVQLDLFLHLTGQIWEISEEFD